MLKRKLEEIGSILYRRLVFPFKRIKTEAGTGSVLKQGSYINKGTVLEGKNYIGKDTVLSNVRLGFGSYVSDDGDMSNTRIGRYTSIGPEVRTVLGKHPVDSKRAALHPAFYSGAGAMGYTYLDASDDKGAGFEEAAYLDKENGIQIVIGNDVWIGRGVMILEGVTIGDGAVIGAGTVVTKNIDPYGIYAGVPARKLRDRFDKDIAEKLLEYQWWNKGEAWIKEHISCFSDAWRLISVLEEEKE